MKRWHGRSRSKGAQRGPSARSATELWGDAAQQVHDLCDRLNLPHPTGHRETFLMTKFVRATLLQLQAGCTVLEGPSSAGQPTIWRLPEHALTWCSPAIFPSQVQKAMVTRNGVPPGKCGVQVLLRCPCTVTVEAVSPDGAKHQEPRACGRVINDITRLYALRMADQETESTDFVCSRCSHKVGEKRAGDLGKRLLLVWWERMPEGCGALQIVMDEPPPYLLKDAKPHKKVAGAAAAVKQNARQEVASGKPTQSRFRCRDDVSDRIWSLIPLFASQT